MEMACFHTMVNMAKFRLQIKQMNREKSENTKYMN